MPEIGRVVAHKGTHQNAGSDEISVAGLSGALADPQTPAGHRTSHQSGGSDVLNVSGLTGIPSVYVTAVFSIAGAVTTGTNKAPSIVMPRSGTIVKAYAYARTAPVGADLIFDVNKNGTTIWSTQANRVKVADGANSGTQTSFDVTSLVEGDRLDLDIDQVGSGTAGSDVTVEVKVAV